MFYRCKFLAPLNLQHGYIQFWQAGTCLTVSWATALATSTSTDAVQIVHSGARHPQQTMSRVPHWRRAARQNGVNANRSAFCGQQQLFSTTSEYHQSIGERAFSYAGPAAWNQLPESIRQLQTTSFKHKLKTFLLTQCYNSADLLCLSVILLLFLALLTM